jgi:hypothetical protein
MRAVAHAQAREAPSQRMASKCSERESSLQMAMPVRAEMSWPRMALRGWARGDSMA